MIHGAAHSEEYEHMRYLNKVCHRTSMMSVAAFVFSYSIIAQGTCSFFPQAAPLLLLLTQFEHFTASLFSVLTFILQRIRRFRVQSFVIVLGDQFNQGMNR